jgi:hypothetical protein
MMMQPPMAPVAAPPAARHRPRPAPPRSRAEPTRVPWSARRWSAPSTGRRRPAARRSSRRVRTVKVGDTLCIIEAMKILNQIECERAGTVKPHPGGERTAGRIQPAAVRHRMIEKVLIANRGEIALRIQRACRELGIKTVAVHSEADRDLKHVLLADESVCIGPAPSRDSYLHIPAIISAAEVTDTVAIHPGYGFLSENADFAERVERSGFVFIGPKPDTIRLMGDKVSAIRAMKQAGVPCVPGSDGPIDDEQQAHAGAGPRDRLPGHHQGRRRRRRARHARGALRCDAAERHLADQGRGRRRLRQRRGLHGEVPGEPAPRRVPGAGRQLRQRHPPGRARLLHAAPPPEGHRRGAGTGHHRRAARTSSASAAPRPAAASATAASAPSSSCTRTASSTSSR